MHVLYPLFFYTNVQYHTHTRITANIIASSRCYCKYVSFWMSVYKITLFSCAYTHVTIIIFIHIYSRTRACECMYTCIYMYIYTYVSVYRHVLLITRDLTHNHARVHTHTHTHTHTHAQTHAHTRTHTHTHMHKWTPTNTHKQTRKQTHSHTHDISLFLCVFSWRTYKIMYRVAKMHWMSFPAEEPHNWWLFLRKETYNLRHPLVWPHHNSEYVCVCIFICACVYVQCCVFANTGQKIAKSNMRKAMVCSWIESLTHLQVAV